MTEEEEEARQAAQLEVPKATLAACEWDLEREEDRMRTIDAKLTALASFAGVSLSITGALGGSVLATTKLSLGFRVGLGAAFCVAVLLLLAGVITAFSALSPKRYRGPKVTAVAERLKRAKSGQQSPAAALLSIALSRGEALGTARKVNKRKARAASRGFRLTGAGLGALVLGVLDVAVASLL